MKQGAKLLACAVAGSGLCLAAAWADVTDTPDVPESENPYTAIVERNIFGLKDPPPPPPVTQEKEKLPPPNINLTGITTLGGSKRAMLKIPATPAKPGHPAKAEQFFMLSEGERDGELEIIQIDAMANTVKVKFADIPSTLDFTNNGVKVAMGPGPGAPGGIPAPGMAPGMNSPGGISLPRPMRLPLPNASGVSRPGYSSVPSATGVQPAAYGGYSGSNPSLRLGAVATRTDAAAANPVHQLPAEQQVMLIEAERQRTQPAVSAGLMPPLPPTPATQMDAPQVQPRQPTGPQIRRFPLRAPGLPALPQ